MADTLSVSLRQIDGASFAAGTGSGHWVPMDTSVKGGGHGAAASPVELILAGLAGCSAMDVWQMLKKMRAPLEDLQIEATAERADDYPRIFTKINLRYRFWGDLNPKQVERAIQLSKSTYCSVSAMLEPKVPIEHQYEIIPAVAAPGAENTK